MHVFTAGTAYAPQSLTEQQQNVPVELGRALHIAALPALTHQIGHVVARDDPASLKIAFVAYDQDRRLCCTHHPVETQNKHTVI